MELYHAVIYDEIFTNITAICMHTLKGTDYLPGCYHNMLKDERRFLILAEVQGEIVSSNMY